MYDELSETFPEKEILPACHSEGVRIDLHSREALERLTGIWHDFISYHTSADFWLDVLRVFRHSIDLIYPDLKRQYGDYKHWSCGTRGVARYMMNMECQPGVNTPQSRMMRVRGPHLDNPVELYGGLLYMGEGEGDLEVQRLKEPARFYGKLEIEDACVETVSTVPYQPNMFVMFLNTPYSVHSVTPRGPTDKCRRLVNIAGEVPQLLFKTGHGRY